MYCVTLVYNLVKNLIWRKTNNRENFYSQSHEEQVMRVLHTGPEKHIKTFPVESVGRLETTK